MAPPGRGRGEGHETCTLVSQPVVCNGVLMHMASGSQGKARGCRWEGLGEDPSTQALQSHRHARCELLWAPVCNLEPAAL